MGQKCGCWIYPKKLIKKNRKERDVEVVPQPKRMRRRGEAEEMDSMAVFWLEEEVVKPQSRAHGKEP